MTATLYAMDNGKSVSGKESGVLLEWLEISTSDNPEFAVIWMHGLGADGHDFEPVVPHLGLPRDLGVRFVFPHALMRPITINGGAVMRAWYDIIEISASKGQDEAGINHSAGKIRELIGHQCEKGIKASNIVLAGFSQGGAMAMHVGLRYPQKLAGIMALSAYLMFPERLQSECSDANGTTPVFIGHGTHDPMVPLSLGQSACSELKAGNWPVEWHTYPIPHSVSQAEIMDIGHWIRSRFSNTS